MPTSEIILSGVLPWALLILIEVTALFLLTWRIERALRTIQNVLAAALLMLLPHLHQDLPPSETPKTELP